MEQEIYKLQEIEHGEKIAHKAEIIWGWGTPAGQKRAQRRAGYLIKFAEIKPGKKILEIGCGTGVFTEKLAQTGAEIVAVDISSHLLSKAQEKISAPNVHLLEADLENLPSLNNYFDAVVGVSILHHVNIRKAIDEISRVLKRGGKVVFSEPNMLNPQIAVQKNVSWIKKWAGDSSSETAFFRRSLARLFEEKGFSLTRAFPKRSSRAPRAAGSCAPECGACSQSRS